VLKKADCCATIVATLDEALRDPHFAERGLFRRKLSSGADDLPALPVPIAEQFRT
jgi:crotonobetainyl-CoA:carnitine CoA-transferase CaiB-like acyl-CoA transferase